MGFTGILTTKLGFEVLEMLPMMKQQEGDLSFKIKLDGQLILYSFETFEITHGLSYSGDPTCKVTTETGKTDFRFLQCYLQPNILYLQSKETIEDLNDLVIVVKQVVTPQNDQAGLYGKLKSEGNLIQELVITDASQFNMTNYTTSVSFQTLTLDYKDSASLN